MEEQIKQKTKEGKTIFKNPIIWVVALLLMGGVGYWAVTSGAIDLNRFGGSGFSQEFVATVNGEGIEKRILDVRFDQIKTSYEIQGIPLGDEEIAQLRNQVLADMIDERLLVQYAKEQDITVDEQAAEQEYQLILSQFESEEAFEVEVTSQDTTLKDVKTSIAEQTIIQELVNQQAAENSIEISAEEVQQAYDDAVANGTEVPPLEEVRDEVEEFVRQQKIVRIMEALLEQLRGEGIVEILI